MFIDMAEFDEYYNVVDTSSITRYNGDNDLIAKIPVITDKIGRNTMRFIINDFMDYPDSTEGTDYVQSLPLLGLFEYEVVSIKY